jgi:nitrite reductase/ring-hydroxylating ferredoxin subunit
MNINIFRKINTFFANNQNITITLTKFKSKMTKKLKNSFTSKMLVIPLTVSCYYFFFKNYMIEKKTFAQSPVLKVPLPDLDSMQDGEMKEIKYGNGPKESFLLVKYNKTFHTLGNFCPHMGAPLHQGVLFDNIIKCPWHGASFDVVTGSCDTYPSINGLIKHDIIKEGGKYYALIDTKTAKKSKVPEMAKRDPDNKTRYVIIGGGPASLSCAETLRQAGFTGEVVIFSQEPYVTYDRTLLSKNLDADINEIKLRDENFLKTYDIIYNSNSKVIGIENSKKIIKLRNGNIEV